MRFGIFRLWYSGDFRCIISMAPWLINGRMDGWAYSRMEWSKVDTLVKWHCFGLIRLINIDKPLIITQYFRSLSKEIPESPLTLLPTLRRWWWGCTRVTIIIIIIMHLKKKIHFFEPEIAGRSNANKKRQRAETVQSSRNKKKTEWNI